MLACLNVASMLRNLPSRRPHDVTDRRGSSLRCWASRPDRYVSTSDFSRCTSQCSGTSPSHSTPEGLRRTLRVEAAGDGAVDDGLLLLLQQLDQLLLGADVAPDPPVHVVEETDDGGLFRKCWQARLDQLEVLRPKAPHIGGDPVGPTLGFYRKRRSSQQVVDESVRRHRCAGAVPHRPD